MTRMEFLELEPSDARWSEVLASTPHDIYHHPAYVALEAKRTGSRPMAGYVRWDSGALLVPLLARGPEDGSGVLDAVSPYGWAPVTGFTGTAKAIGLRVMPPSGTVLMVR